MGNKLSAMKNKVKVLLGMKKKAIATFETFEEPEDGEDCPVCALRARCHKFNIPVDERLGELVDGRTGEPIDVPMHGPDGEAAFDMLVFIYPGGLMGMGGSDEPIKYKLVDPKGDGNM